MAKFTIPAYAGPALVGSVKQVDWASTIRDEKMWLAQGYACTMTQRTDAREEWSGAKKALYHDLTARAVTALGAHTAASWWIGHRAHGIEELVEDERRALMAALSAEEKARIRAL